MELDCLLVYVASSYIHFSMCGFVQCSLVASRRFFARQSDPNAFCCTRVAVSQNKSLHICVMKLSVYEKIQIYRLIVFYLALAQAQ